MAKEFNYTGTCIPNKHYMVETSTKIDQVIDLINRGKYFTINRPRQYGKTTTIFLLNKRLSQMDDYFAVKLSFEGIGSAVFKTEKDFTAAFIKLMADKIELNNEDLADFLRKEGKDVTSMQLVSRLITQFIKKTGKKVVLLIDEVDKSSNNQMFLHFIGMLREKYLSAQEEEDITFQSVILAGVHDVKNLKLKLRPEEKQVYNSPWNIAVDFTVDLAFSAKEIESMLTEFSKATGTKMDIPALAEYLHYYTSGYPFLVSKLCYIIDAYIIEDKQEEWTKQHIDLAVKHILGENNTNFESLIKNLENNRELYDLVYSIIIEGNIKSFNWDNPHINMGVEYGIFKTNSSSLKIHNRVYEQRIYNYMGSKIETSLHPAGYNFEGKYILDDNKLDFRKIVVNFQQFMKEQYSKKDTEFLENNGRLIFLAFIKPIINGHGFDFKEVQISEEKRLDVVVTYYNHKYVVELKKWYGPEAHLSGLKQLSDYLERQGLDEGFLLIYDFRNKKKWKQEEFAVDGKRIFAVWL